MDADLNNDLPVEDTVEIVHMELTAGTIPHQKILATAEDKPPKIAISYDRLVHGQRGGRGHPQDRLLYHPRALLLGIPVLPSPPMHALTYLLPSNHQL